MVNFFIQLAVMVVSSFIMQALAPKPPTPKAASLEDVDATMAEEGQEIPVIFGTYWMSSPNILWYGDMKTRAIKTKTGK